MRSSGRTPNVHREAAAHEMRFAQEPQARVVSYLTLVTGLVAAVTLLPKRWKLKLIRTSRVLANRRMDVPDVP
jgi:hypothetical protein